MVTRLSLTNFVGRQLVRVFRVRRERISSSSVATADLDLLRATLYSDSSMRNMIHSELDCRNRERSTSASSDKDIPSSIVPAIYQL